MSRSNATWLDEARRLLALVEELPRPEIRGRVARRGDRAGRDAGALIALSCGHSVVEVDSDTARAAVGRLVDAVIENNNRVDLARWRRRPPAHG